MLIGNLLDSAVKLYYAFWKAVCDLFGDSGLAVAKSVLYGAYSISP